MFSLLTLRIILYSIIQLWIKAISIEEVISSKLIYFDINIPIINTFVSSVIFYLKIISILLILLIKYYILMITYLASKQGEEY